MALIVEPAPVPPSIPGIIQPVFADGSATVPAPPIPISGIPIFPPPLLGDPAAAPPFPPPGIPPLGPLVGPAVAPNSGPTYLFINEVATNPYVFPDFSTMFPVPTVAVTWGSTTTPTAPPFNMWPTLPPMTATTLIVT